MQQVQTPGATSPSCGQAGLKCCSYHTSVSLSGQGHSKGEVNKTPALLLYVLQFCLLAFHYFPPILSQMGEV